MEQLKFSHTASDGIKWYQNFAKLAESTKTYPKMQQPYPQVSIQQECDIKHTNKDCQEYLWQH